MLYYCQPTGKVGSVAEEGQGRNPHGAADALAGLHSLLDTTKQLR